MSNNNSNLKTNTTSLQELLNAVNNLPEAGIGEINLQDKTVDPSTTKQVISADDGYDGLDTVTINPVETTIQATPSITVNSSGLITASATQSEGYVSSGTKSSTKQLAFQPAKTITPSATNQIAVSSGYYTGGNITVKGDSNLKPENIKSGVSIFGINGTASSGGSSDTSMEDGLVTREVNVYTNDRVMNIGDNAFRDCRSLTSVNFPVCSYIGDNAFCDCRSLTSVNFPVCSYIGDNAFCDCFSLTSVSFPACSYIGSYAFDYCYNLTSVSFPACISIGDNAFYSCSSLTSVSFPACSYIGSYAFYDCFSLTSVSFPACTSIGDNAFRACRTLSQVYLMNSTICTLNHSEAFLTTPFTGYSLYFSGTPSIFVPTSLVDAYKSAYNWKYFSSYIVGNGEGINNNVNIITFMIKGVEYQAKDGMTWGEWINSEYNTDGYYTDPLGQIHSKGGSVLSARGEDSFPIPLSSDSVIISTYTYKY
jgi:hypothetical protein